MSAKHKKPIGPSAKPIPKVISFQDPLPEPQRYRPQADRILSGDPAQTATNLFHLTGLMQNANSTWLNGRPLDRDLEVALATPVRLANDANCFALSEAVDGAAESAHIVFGVILGTGCGGGIVVDGRLVNGPRGIGGEWGHNPLPWATPEEYPGPQCWCGRWGCLETWVSGPGMAADHSRVTGETLSAVEIAARAKLGNGAAESYPLPARRSTGARAGARHQYYRP